VTKQDVLNIYSAHDVCVMFIIYTYCTFYVLYNISNDVTIVKILNFSDKQIRKVYNYVYFIIQFLTELKIKILLVMNTTSKL